MSSDKQAGGLSSALDLLFSIIGQGSSSTGKKMFNDAKKKLGTDDQSKKLLTDVMRKVAESLELTRNEHTALNYAIMGMKNVNVEGAARNSIFKAANALGMRLPSSMFASEDDLQGKLQKLASENPELRGHLVPVLKEAAKNLDTPMSILLDLMKIWKLPSGAKQKRYNKFSYMITFQDGSRIQAHYDQRYGSAGLMVNQPGNTGIPYDTDADKFSKEVLKRHHIKFKVDVSPGGVEYIIKK